MQGDMQGDMEDGMEDGMEDDLDAEFDRQLTTMVAVGYPGLAGLGAGAFASLVEPLREVVHNAVAPVEAADEGAARATWLIVVPPELVPAESIAPLLRLPGGSLAGVVDRNHGAEPLSAYAPLAVLGVPDGVPYVVFDVDRGDEFRGVRPRDAVPVILERGRTPLTIHEGLALALHRPGSLERNHCYMLAGSRRGDKRVPALWISQGAPKLGWCWDGNLHTWLGIASAGGRAAGAAGHAAA